MTRNSPHERKTVTGIHLPDPDQGEPFVQVQLAFPSTMFLIYEPFEDDEKGGHNVLGFARRWAAWVASDEPEFHAIELRFGHPIVFPRSIIPHVAGFQVAYHRREDARAGHRAPLEVPGGPMVRRNGRNEYEIRIPRG
jgi:hypothetical protein